MAWEAVADERVSFVRRCDLAGLEVLQVRRSTRRWQWFHETYVVSLISGRSGGRRTRYRSWEFDEVPGVVALYEPGEVHRNVADFGPMDYDAVLISTGVVAETAEQLELPSAALHLRMPSTRDPTFRTAVSGALAAAAGDAPLEAQTRVALLARELLERFGMGPAPNQFQDRPVVGQARDYLHAHLDAAVRLDDLAAACATSKYHLVRVFSEAVGLPPSTYHRLLRLDKVKRLLADGVGVGVAASATGFTDQAHLTRHFARTYGVTPGRYRRIATA